ncbi:mediator of RNA polymerase II transcription subunit 15a-like isoform X1 [Salvia splendens]|uniref:mediator of RNA polymerase II transcription subunit 15a-like isoform X1 n=1 Tax=Salvia splendens TaxID=180675 RepID=UPI001C2593BD|nr:mediator of RNA polymerase II transcription subunit 15a-like isoform X1 [Salvia splendens]XP_042063122.1 mediator of RNA polymerase II transcription subunit 15a-like isoform X1 [Salvia splendens]
MDNNSWRSAQGQVPMASQVIGGEAVPAAGMEGGDWRSQLQQDSRQRIVNKIMETLKRHLPFSGQEGLQELKKIAIRFEEKIYTAATSQSDYLRRISLKMLTMENKSQNPMANSLQSNAASNSKNPQDPVSQSMQSQMQNQVQQLPIPMVSNQSRQQILSQNIQNNIPSTGVPNSAGLTPSMPSVGSMTQGTMPNVSIQNPNMQNMSSITPNAVGNSMGQGVPANMYASSQRQIMGRQQQVVSQDGQQQSQNSQQYLYNQQLQQQILKQKYGQGGLQQSMVQSQQQQQNLLQPNQLQSSQPAVMQSSLRQTSASSTLQNQQTSLQQSSQSMLQQQPQPVLRQQQQQQPQQPPIMHQQQSSISQHPMLSSQQQQQQQQQQLSTQQPSPANMQQNQMIAQQNNMLDTQHQQQQQQRIMTQQSNISNMQQHQSINQQNNLPNMHQQQSSGQQNNLPNMHQQQSGGQANLSGFQQQQMGGIQHVNSSLQSNQQPVHILQQSKLAAQQQMQQNMANMLPNQAQPSQSQPMQQQLMSQIQSQPGQLQQQMGLQQPPNTLPRDMQQRIQSSGPMLQQQATIDQQKQLLQSSRVMPEVPLTSLDSSSQTGNANGGEWQEEIYQKIKSMHELYYPELNDMYQRMAAKLQQHDSHPQQPKNDQLDKLRFLKVMLERLIMFLRTNKNDIQANLKEKVAGVEKQILNLITSNRPRKPGSSLQGQVTQPHMHALQQPQQQQPQMSQMHSNEGQMNPQMQQMNIQSSMMPTQQNNMTSLQHNTLSSGYGVSNSRQNMLDGLPPSSNIDPGQGNVLNQMQQQGTMNSLQQNPVGVSQQMASSISSQNGPTSLQPNVNSLQSNSNTLQPQQIKQEQQMFSSQHLKQFQQRQMQQQYMPRQQLLQQQQQQQQTSQQQLGQFPGQQMTQLNQMNDTNDMKTRHQMGAKPGGLQQHNSSGHRTSYHHQQMKPGTPFSMSSQNALQATSPQIGHHSSPQIDQQSILTLHNKAGTPLQSANSPFVAPSPSTSMAPSPMPGDSEKMNSGISSISNAGNGMHHPTTAVSMPNQSLAIGTPGISASPLLAEFPSPDVIHGVAPTIVSRNSNVVEQPVERLIKVAKFISPKALSASVSDISSVVSMVDRIAGSAPGNGSRAAVGEDLVAMTKCRLQARNFFTQDGPSGAKKMRRYTSAMPCNVVSSSGSVNNDNLRHLNGNESDGESTGASNVKRPRTEANHALEEELRDINQRLIDTVVYISEDDVDPTAVAAASEGGEGTIVKCSFSAVALSPNLKSQYASAQISPIQPLRLLVPNTYPNCSPILLDKFPAEVSKEYEDLSIKAKSRFSISLRSLTQPMSLEHIARTWDNCARAVISEYAQKSGGGTFSSKYGTWDDCRSAA